jgi:pimeloyl-ACP methyl ester carboxylesterase
MMTSGYAPIQGGPEMYFERQGVGPPLLLLHGGYGATESFRDLVPQLGSGRELIAADLQGHGRTGDVDRPLRFERLADDVAALLAYLDVDRADLLGYSLGGSVALRTAIQHSDHVRRLVLISTPYASTGWYPEIRASMRQMDAAQAEPMKQTPLYELYARLAPDVDAWPRLWATMGALLEGDYDWSTDVGGLRMPVMLLVGDADSIHPSHMTDFFGLLGGGKRDGSWDGSGVSSARLAMLPGITHYDVLTWPYLAATVAAFLDQPGG